ncbi:MAG TPA: hypothetical protein VMB47_05720 [Candidatus Aquilonibacter sp.]|nr:hypothetical protein [Candidatus Aquilonibacter sp.]
MGVLRRFGGERDVARVPGWLAVLALLVICAGCQRLKPVDTHALDMAGMGYDAVSQLKALKISQDEVAQVAEARQAGLSDAGCVQVMQIYRSRKQAFDGGDSIAGLLGAGADEDLVLKLARLNQLGLGAGELEAMRLAGLSDDVLLAVAQHHAAGQPVLSGASLASMKNLGMGSNTLLQLAEHGVPDSKAGEIMALRRRGVRDSEILRQFAGS